jgi:hypothetical protein
MQAMQAKKKLSSIRRGLGVRRHHASSRGVSLSESPRSRTILRHPTGRSGVRLLQDERRWREGGGRPVLESRTAYLIYEGSRRARLAWGRKARGCSMLFCHWKGSYLVDHGEEVQLPCCRRSRLPHCPEPKRLKPAQPRRQPL